MSGDSDSGNATNSSRREKRHQRLLAIARDIMVTEGMIGLSIDKLAKKAGITRPTVYSHFRSKKAVLIGVAEQNRKVTEHLMDRASSFEGSFRERAFGLILAYEVMARFETEEFHMTEFLGMPWVRSELPAEVATSFAELVTSYFCKVQALVVAAVDAGELKVPAGMTVETIVFHSLSGTYGVYTSIIKDRIILKLSLPDDPWAEARSSLNFFWDGLGWETLSSQADYVAVADRFLKEVFPDYWIKQEIDKLRKREGMLEEGDGETEQVPDESDEADDADEDPGWTEGSGEEVD